MADDDQSDDYDDEIVEDGNGVNPLEEDHETPFSQPAAQEGKISVGHPQTDTGLDSHELYDEGLASAAGVSDPSTEDSVGRYVNPELDHEEEIDSEGIEENVS